MVKKYKNWLNEIVTPKTYVQSEMDKLLDKGLDNLSAEEIEFLKNPHKKDDEDEKPKQEILKYHQIAEEFFRNVIGRDVRNFELNDNLDLWDIMNDDDEVFNIGNILYYKYGIQIDPEINDDFKLVNIFKKISEKS